MSNSMRRTLIAVLSGAALLILCLCIGFFAFMAGRHSMTENGGPATLLPGTAEQVESDPNGSTASIESQTEEVTSPETNVIEDGLGQNEETAEPPASGETSEAETASQPPAVEVTQQEPVHLSPDDFEIMTQVWDIISQQFDGDLPNSEDVVHTAIQQSLELLDDDYTQYIPPEIADQVREQLEGSFEGIGAFVDMTEDGYLLIVRPIEGQPADLAGLKSNDVVTHVNGESVLGKTQEEIVNEVKGPRGTEVTLTIVRESEPQPFDVTIVRALVELPIVESQMLDNNIGYVRLTSFTSNSAQQLSDELDALFDQNPQALIFDLRDNPGGFLNQSVAIADLFLPEGIVVYQRNRNGEEEIFRSQTGDIAEEIPLVVLVNAGSASASEIVAGAIQDRGRGMIVGEISFGKGSVQNTLTLSDGSELRVTIARWYTPDNNSINGEGITPDVEVPLEGDFGTATDSQIRQAIEILSNEGT
ncbi:MAG: S41 family peptidase [Candidatus Promineifilaceae bacterium]